MKNIKFLIITVCLASITSCNNNQDVAIDKTPAKKTYNKMLFTGTTKYSLIFENADRKIGYFATKQDALSKEELSVLGIDDIDLSQRNEPTDNPFLFKINGMAANELKNIANSEDFDLRNHTLFGQTIDFSVFNKNAENGSTNRAPAQGKEMYVPEIVKITSPSIAQSRDLLPYCYYKNFKLGWNADPKNKNGLVVVVEWLGTDMFGQEHNTSVHNLDIITEDNGSCILNDQLFDNIPQGALAKLVLLRGNIEMFEQNINEDDAFETYQIIAASIEILPFIMIKERM